MLQGIDYNIDVEKFDDLGYALIPNVLTDDEVRGLRNNTHKLLKKTFLEFNDGKVLPGWAGRHKEMGKFRRFHADPRILTIVSKLVGNNWIFAEHADLHQDKVTGWHRDILKTSTEKASAFQTLDIWCPEYRIIKVSFLLQDHRNNDQGIAVEPGTHKSEDLTADPIWLHSSPKDAIVFDQRIRHRGQEGHNKYLEATGDHRYLITFGYGLNNEHTAQHVAGTVFRQNQQREEMSKFGGCAKMGPQVHDNPGINPGISYF